MLEVLTEMMKQSETRKKNPNIRIHLPTSPVDGASLGYAFVTFETEEAARVAVDVINDAKFGKSVMKVYPYASLEKFEKLTEGSLPPKTNKKTEVVDLTVLESRLLDGRDQFVVRHEDETVVSWVDSLALDGATEVVYGGERDKASGKSWCKQQVMWSPSGKYLVTFHTQGLGLWGGPDFQRVGRFPHQGVVQAQFSPCERYILTWDGSANGKDKEPLIAWNVRMGTKKKTFMVDPSHAEWPIMKWSHDGSYFGRAVENGISVFCTPSMDLLDKAPIQMKGLTAFEWSPSDNFVAYWCPEDGNVPAHVAVYDVVNKKEIRSKNVFNVNDVSLFWQSRGDFFCAQVTRHSKTKRTLLTNFEFFRMRDSQVPNETLSMNEGIGAFSFEPGPGFRFGVVHTLLPDGVPGSTMNVSFFSLGAVKDGEKIEKLEMLERKACTNLIWSPTGGVVLLAFLDLGYMNAYNEEKPGDGSFEFYDVDAKHAFGVKSHFKCNEVAWDPSGRFLVSIVKQPMTGNVARKYMMGNAYQMWSFQGVKMGDEVKCDRLYQFLWRPRAKLLLTEEEQEKVRKNLPNTMKRYEKEDAMLKKRKQASENAGRVKMLSEFRFCMRERHEEFVLAQQERIKRGYIQPSSKAEFEEIVETVDEIISEKIEEIP